MSICKPTWQPDEALRRRHHHRRNERAALAESKAGAKISFTEWTNYGLLRHGTFKGLRADKEPRSIVRE
jgi:bifunctional non-homologous end joining protein LigD